MKMFFHFGLQGSSWVRVILLVGQEEFLNLAKGRESGMLIMQ